MDKQDPLAHPLLQWYRIFILFLKTALSLPAQGGSLLQNLQGSLCRPLRLRFHHESPGSLSLDLAPHWGRSGLSGAEWTHSQFDSGLSVM